MFDDRSPIYRQIAEQIRADVLSGALKGDDQVMSTNQYAKFHRINPATVAKAFGNLVEQGVLYKKRGLGMFVSPGARDALRGEHRESFMAEVVDPMLERARLIGIPLEDVADRIRQAQKQEHAQENEKAEQQ